MPKPKGHKGETCFKAIREIVKPGEIYPFSKLYSQIKEKGDWEDETIYQHLMSVVVNLVPARYRWQNIKPFLFLCGDGQYELYDPGKHPKIVP